MPLNTLPSKWKQPRRSRNGRYAPKLKNLKVVVGLVLSIMTMSLLSQQSEHQKLMDMLYPTYMTSQPTPENFFMVGQVKAKEIETPSASASPSIEDRIRMRFQKKGDEAVAIGTCESNLNSQAHGDKGLMVFDPKYNEWVGDSKGMFQIRTGGMEKNGKIWNRARANGMTADEFRKALENDDFNMEQAYMISKGGESWGAWKNCARKEGL